MRHSFSCHRATLLAGIIGAGLLLGGMTSLALAAAGAARPAATTTLTVEAAGDGAAEVRGAGGTLARVMLATPPLRRGTATARQVDVEGHRIVELRVPVRGRAAEEVWIAELGASRAARVIWSGVAGTRGADEEISVAVEVTPERIFEYQTAAQVSRCDGEPVRLFTRAWDFGSGKFRPVLSTPPPAAPSPQRLTARRGDPAMPATRPLGGFHFTAASTTAGAGREAGSLAAPTALDDGDPGTVWAEGLGGDGRGEFLTARASAGHYRVRGFRIVPGDASKPGSFKAKNRLKSVVVALGPEADRHFDVDFPDDPAAAGEGKAAAPYWVAFPRPIDSACLTVIIRDVYPGNEKRPPGGGGTTAISDLEIFTELDDASGVQRLITDISTGVDCQSRVPLLVALGEPAVAPAAKAISTGGAAGAGSGPAGVGRGAAGGGRECLVEALSRLEGTARSAPALEALTSALVGASAAEERLVSETLRRAQKNDGPVPLPAIVGLATAGSPITASDRVRAVRLLAELQGPQALAGLLTVAGAEDPELRLAVVQALGRSPAATVPLLIAAIDRARATGGAPGARREADLIRALPSLSARAPQDRGQAVEAVRRALATSPSFEVRARAILALGQLGSPGTGTGGSASLASELVSELVSVREQSNDAVLRFLAARELGTLSGPSSLVPLRAALTDVDPRVRETAAQGLGFHRDSASEAVLIAAAKAEPWPFARRAQVEALSKTCGAPARELLARAIERDVDEVRRASLVGLVRCHDPRARPTLLATLKNRHASAALRELSGALLGELGDHTVTPELADTVGTLVNEAEGDLAIEGVATSAIRSLGRLGGAAAAGAAARAAADTRHPAYHRVAIESLGQMCDPDQGAKALAAARAGRDPALAAAAEKAQQHCR
ncbi:MAG: HEAT repeat domain-containing protein [Myxococcales bacterium]